MSVPVRLIIAVLLLHSFVWIILLHRSDYCCELQPVCRVDYLVIFEAVALWKVAYFDVSLYEPPQHKLLPCPVSRLLYQSVQCDHHSQSRHLAGVAKYVDFFEDEAFVDLILHYDHKVADGEYAEDQRYGKESA